MGDFDYQRQFVQLVRGLEENEKFLNSIGPAGTLDAKGALEVYRMDYISRLSEVLGEAYPAIWKILGDERFHRLCHDFIDQRPSATYSLNLYGKEMSDFLSTSQDAQLKELAFLPDLAVFEWAFLETFHLPQHQSLSGEDLQQLANLEEKVLLFPFSMRLFSWETPIKDIWDAANDEARDSFPEDLDWKKRQHMVLYKHLRRVHFKELDETEMYLLRTLQEGYCLNEALEKTSERFPELSPETVSNLFQFLMGEGLITEVK